MAILQFGQNLGQAAGSPLSGAVLDSTGGDWFMSSVMVQVPILVVGIVLAILVKPFKARNNPPLRRTWQPAL